MTARVYQGVIVAAISTTPSTAPARIYQGTLVVAARVIYRKGILNIGPAVHLGATPRLHLY